MTTVGRMFVGPWIIALSGMMLGHPLWWIWGMILVVPVVIGLLEGAYMLINMVSIEDEDHHR